MQRLWWAHVIFLSAFAAGACSLLAPSREEATGGNRTPADASVLDHEAGSSDATSDAPPDVASDAAPDAVADTGSADGSTVPLGSLILWLKADDVGTAAGPLQTWPDRSGQHHDATQAAPTLRPTRVDGVQNGLPVVRFDGMDDYFELTGDFGQLTTGVSLFFVVHATDSRAYAGLIDLGNQPSNGNNLWVARDSSNLDIAYGGGGGKALHTSVNAYPIDTTLLIEIDHTSQTANIAVNGVTSIASPLALPDPGPRTANYLARSSADTTFGGDVAEVLVYSPPLKAPEQQAVAAYLTSKWGCCK
jgi:hypothetical protein